MKCVVRDIPTAVIPSGRPKSSNRTSLMFHATEVDGLGGADPIALAAADAVVRVHVDEGGLGVVLSLDIAGRGAIAIGKYARHFLDAISGRDRYTPFAVDALVLVDFEFEVAKVAVAGICNGFGFVESGFDFGVVISAGQEIQQGHVMWFAYVVVAHPSRSFSVGLHQLDRNMILAADLASQETVDLVGCGLALGYGMDHVRAAGKEVASSKDFCVAGFLSDAVKMDFWRHQTVVLFLAYGDNEVFAWFFELATGDGDDLRFCIAAFVGQTVFLKDHGFKLFVFNAYSNR